jgi:hypothetical protein
LTYIKASLIDRITLILRRVSQPPQKGDQMSTLHQEKPSQSPVRNFLDWCRAQLKSESEFGCRCDAEIERMARDIRMSPSEFRAAASRGPKSANLLMRRMAALDLDPNEVGRIEPAAFRDLQRVCTLCKSRRRCARDFARNAPTSAWDRYCQNSDTLAALSGTPWRSRQEW